MPTRLHSPTASEPTSPKRPQSSVTNGSQTPRLSWRPSARWRKRPTPHNSSHGPQRTFSRWMCPSTALPPSHPNALLLYIGTKDGGLGLPHLSDQIDLRKWTILCRLQERGGLPALAIDGLLNRAAASSGGQFLTPPQGTSSAHTLPHRLVATTPTIPLSGTLLVGVLGLQQEGSHTHTSPSRIRATRLTSGPGGPLPLSGPPRLVLGRHGT